MTQKNNNIVAFNVQIGRLNKELSPNIGPGTYNHTREFGSELGNLTIGKKLQSQSPESLIGPGFYTPKVPETSRRVDFGKMSKRETNMPDQERGPGFYHKESKLADK